MILLLAGYFTWSVDPIAFSIPRIELPFLFSFPVFIVFAVLTYYMLTKTKKMPGNKVVPAFSKSTVWGVGLGVLFLGHLFFANNLPFSFGHIGPIQPRWYGIMFALAFVFGYQAGNLTFQHAGRKPEDIEKLLSYILIATIIGARLGHVIFYDLDYYLRNPAQIPAIWNGGLASHGAAIAILIAMWMYARNTKGISFLWLADRVVIGVGIGGAFIRLGNFFNSEIYGHVTDVPWAVVFSRIDELPRHPTMLYESLQSAIIVAIMWFIYKKYKHNPPEGSLFSVFLIALFGGRFLIEYTKIPQAAFASDWAINMGQWLSVPLVLAGIWLLLKKVDWKKNKTALT